MSFFINYIKIPFPESVNTFGLSDGFLYTYTFTGFYLPAPFANDNFDLYPTGGGQFTQLFFSGSGDWSQSGCSFSQNHYLIDSFNEYGTGSGILFLTAGQTISGYSVFDNLAAGYISNSGGQQAIIFTFYDLFENYQTGTISGYGQFGISNNALTGFVLQSGFTIFPQTGYSGYSVWSGYYN